MEKNELLTKPERANQRTRHTDLQPTVFSESADWSVRFRRLSERND